MSTSSLHTKTGKPTPPDQSDSDRLSRSQALLITAGLAGFIGLFSGLIMRFSLSNSPTARFLSPLQTFPDLADWAPELPQGTADSHYLPGGGPSADDAANAATSDYVRARDLAPDTEETVEPEPTDTRVYSAEDDSSPDASNDSGYSQEAEVTAPYAEDPVIEESYTESDPEVSSEEVPYPEPYPEEPYPEDDYSSENYPATEEPVGDEGADYESGQY